MDSSKIKNVVNQQRKFFQTGATLPVKFRIEALKKLKANILANEKEIAAAIKADLGKSETEAFMCEIGLVITEISYMLKHVRKFAKDKTVSTPLSNFPAHSFVKSSPYGNVLIMSPWNYPFLLTLDPLVDAISAGNTVVVKPSAYSPATSAAIEKVLQETFAPEYVAVVTGGRAENACLLEQKFDYIFFTGSQAVGREVLRHAAEFLTPCTLELGGKSPCIIDSSAKIKLAATRLVWGKYLNCGQTCVAPDYVLCHSSVKDQFIKAMAAEIKAQFGQDPLANKDYGKIINQKHFERVRGLINKDKVAVGGRVNAETQQIEPTVMDNVTWEDAVMGEEIFGPVLPVLTFDSYDQIYQTLNDKAKPLAFYLFTENRKLMKEFTSRFNFGGGCINDCIIHLATNNLGFGGCGESGMGAYHGKVGFDTFSTKKSIVNRKTFMDVPLRKQPYSGLKRKLLDLVLR
ncbi:MAG: aldehyde dehydrogenase [Spirochaetia bacterium]|nr:aldehyde dehydrogenase [Spirochaetia bacterium]MDD7269993.1 aldehyde dehydrogenase [Treponema sp.]MDY4984715.1 aldehyde dehydrogenase [Treponema sp.]